MRTGTGRVLDFLIGAWDRLVVLPGLPCESELPVPGLPGPWSAPDVLTINFGTHFPLLLLTTLSCQVRHVPPLGPLPMSCLPFAACNLKLLIGLLA